MLKDKFGFNFWPSFTDLMLSFVLVVLIILFVVSRILAADSENLKEAQHHQDEVVQIIEKDLNGYVVKDIRSDNAQEIKKFITDNKADVYIISTYDRQTITFSDKILFDSGQSIIKAEGRNILNAVGSIIAHNIDNFKEIQIQGHADTDKAEWSPRSNLELASDRAISVYNLLVNQVGISPVKELISVTSYGEYKPVGREPGLDFDSYKLQQANANKELKAKNRRIEIVLYYKNAHMQNEK